MTESQFCKMDIVPLSGVYTCKVYCNGTQLNSGVYIQKTCASFEGCGGLGKLG